MFLPKGIPFAQFITYLPGRRKQHVPSIWSPASSSEHQTCPQSNVKRVFAGSWNDESFLRAWGGWETIEIQMEKMFRLPSGFLWNVMRQSPDLSRVGQTWCVDFQERCKGTLYGQDETESTAKRLNSSSQCHVLYVSICALEFRTLEPTRTASKCKFVII